MKREARQGSLGPQEGSWSLTQSRVHIKTKYWAKWNKCGEHVSMKTAKAVKMLGFSIMVHSLFFTSFLCPLPFDFYFFLDLLIWIQLLLVQVLPRLLPIFSPKQRITQTWLRPCSLNENVSYINNKDLSLPEGMEPPGGLCLLAPQQVWDGTDMHWPVPWYGLSSVWAGAPRNICLSLLNWQGRELFTSLTHTEWKCQQTSGTNTWIWNANLFTLRAVGTEALRHSFLGINKKQVVLDPRIDLRSLACLRRNTLLHLSFKLHIVYCSLALTSV